MSRLAVIVPRPIRSCPARVVAVATRRSSLWRTLPTDGSPQVCRPVATTTTRGRAARSRVPGAIAAGRRPRPVPFLPRRAGRRGEVAVVRGRAQVRGQARGRAGQAAARSTCRCRSRTWRSHGAGPTLAWARRGSGGQHGGWGAMRRGGPGADPGTAGGGAALCHPTDRCALPVRGTPAVGERSGTTAIG